MDDLKAIHTLNARGHIFLEVVREYFSLSPLYMHSQIQSLRNEAETSLKAKGILYDQLRGALTPDTSRREIAFIFDAYELSDVTWYGLDVFRRFMPLFDVRSSHSVLAGDFLGENHQQDRLYEIFCDVVVPAREITWRHSVFFYIIYINNLTDQMLAYFNASLSDYHAYAGFADCTYDSPFKRHISAKLCNIFLKHRQFIIQGDPDDGYEGQQDANVSGYPFEDFGYTCRSVNDILFGVLLSFKIERPVLKGFESDTEFGLNAIMVDPSSLDSFKVSVDEAKLAYLKAQKSGSIERACLENTSAEGLAEIIGGKIAGSYIYEMKVVKGARLFNLMIEVSSNNGDRTRLRCGLKYESEKKLLKLVTMF